MSVPELPELPELPAWVDFNAGLGFAGRGEETDAFTEVDSDADADEGGDSDTGMDVSMDGAREVLAMLSDDYWTHVTDSPWV